MDDGRVVLDAASWYPDVRCRCDPPRESRDPRRSGTCDKCGHHIDHNPLTERVGEHHHERATVTEAVKGGRDEAFENGFLRQAQVLSGLASGGWDEEVRRRLKRMEREKGRDTYLNLTMRRKVLGFGDEGLDLGGWGITIALSTRAQMDEDLAADMQALALQGAALGPRVSEIVKGMLALVREQEMREVRRS